MASSNVAYALKPKAHVCICTLIDSLARETVEQRFHKGQRPHLLSNLVPNGFLSDELCRVPGRLQAVQ